MPSIHPLAKRKIGSERRGVKSPLPAEPAAICLRPLHALKLQMVFPHGFQGRPIPVIRQAVLVEIRNILNSKKLCGIVWHI
jgi:hypothetical protein